MSGATTVDAAVCREFGAPLSIETLRLAAPREEEVRVDLTACAVCHSDVSFIDGLWGGRLPAVYGHEAVGVVAGAGPGVTTEVGSTVVVTLVRSCGTCRPCRRGFPSVCSTTFPLDAGSPLTDGDGHPVTHGLRTAAFATSTVVHQSQIVPVGEDLPPASAALLACGVLTGVGAVTNTAAVEPDSTVVVVGCGGVGLSAVQGARLAHAGTIVAVDPEPAKRELARRLGATRAVDPVTDDVAAFVAEATRGEGADYVFVAVGQGPAIESSLALVGPTGALVVVGMPATGVTTTVEPGNLAAAGQRILGSKMGSARIERDIPDLERCYRNGDLLLDELVSDTFPLCEINTALDQVRVGAALRNVIVF